MDLSLDVGAGAGDLTRMLREHPALATPLVSVWAWVLLFMGYLVWVFGVFFFFMLILAVLMLMLLSLRDAEGFNSCAGAKKWLVSPKAIPVGGGKASSSRFCCP
jgi:hypothetical protein